MNMWLRYKIRKRQALWHGASVPNNSGNIHILFQLALRMWKRILGHRCWAFIHQICTISRSRRRNIEAQLTWVYILGNISARFVSKWCAAWTQSKAGCYRQYVNGGFIGHTTAGSVAPLIISRSACIAVFLFGEGSLAPSRQRNVKTVGDCTLKVRKPFNTI